MKFVTQLAVALVAVGWVAAAGQTAGAGTPAQKKIKVLGMQIEGADLSAKDKQDLFKVVRAALGSRDTIDLLKPPERELTDEMIDLECIDVDAACLSRLGAKYKADRVFYSQVDKGTKGAYTLLVRVVDVKKRRLVHNATVKIASRMGVANGLEQQVTKVFGESAGAAASKAKDHGFIEIKANLEDAKIFINKEFAATGEVKVKRKLGKYTVEVKHDGYQPQLFTVEVTAGRTTTRVVTMKGLAGGSGPKQGAAAAVDETEFYETWWFWTVIGVVVAGGVTGIIVATMDDGDPSPLGNASFSVDPQQAWRDYDVLGGQP